MTRARGTLGGESGAVIVLVAVALPLLIILLAFVVETANWWVHKRHLQIQADAAALAGAGKYRFPVCDDTVIEQTVLRYSGKGDAGGTVYNEPLPQTVANEQATGAEKLQMVLNGPSPFGRTQPFESELQGSPSPCAAKMVDVKMTETDIPWFFEVADFFSFGALNLVEFADAQARVELRQLTSLAGVLPVGVEDVNPKRVHVWLFDEDTGQDLADAELYKGASANGLVYFNNESGTGAGAPMVLNVESQRIGVRVAMSGSDSITCGQPLVLCYGFGAGAKGVSRIRGYRTAGTGAQLREVLLSPASMCAATDGGYFSTACSIETLDARIDGIAPTATVDAFVTGGANKGYALAYDTVTGTWKGDVPVTPVGGGARSITLKWEQTTGTVGDSACATGNSNPCKGSFDNAHSTFAGGRSVSGPMKALDVTATPLLGGVAADGNNVGRCAAGESGCEQGFTISVGVGGRLELSDPADPPVSLRVFSGSQNQSLDCDPAVQGLDTEIASGCGPEYRKNTGESCPATATALWTSPQPWGCAAIQTGTNANAPARGLNTRVYGDPSPGPACPSSGANQWPAYPEGDRRVVPVFLVPFGSFDGSGSGTVPVLDFSFFYVTGWTSNGNGFQNPCKDEGDQFAPGTENDSGAISGHFIKNVNPNVGGGGEQPCDFDSIGGCVAVLTK